MGELLTPADIAVFFGSLVAVMAVGLWAGRKEETSEDYYLAGKNTRWWGVAGSIFGSNVSANHMVGMMGAGFSVGFAPSHFEIGAIAGLLLLCYGFLPMYRKLNLYTLSDYLARRYDDRSRIAYAVIMLTVMIVIGMLPGFYIGSRTVVTLLQGGTGDINVNHYRIAILLMAFVVGAYTIIGGLKAVIVTDVIQSVLVLLAGIAVAVITFSQTEVGGWFSMAARDAAEANKLHLYEPVNHPELPWTGVLTGVMILHFYYWGTNQFIVQRALSARSDGEARLGIIIAGFGKLLIPLFSIGTGIAAFYLFKDRGVDVAQDTVFATLLTELVAPMGYGLLGLIAAGTSGAILSTVDSKMNSSATIITFDIYKRYVNPDASEKRLVWIGRLCVVVLVVGSALLTTIVMDPNSKESFFLYVVKHQSKLIAGVITAFFIGMLWKRSTAPAGVVTVVAGVVFSYGIPPLYARTLGTVPSVASVLGPKLNSYHAILAAAVGCAVLNVAISLLTQPNEEKAKLTWTGQGVLKPSTLRTFALVLGLSLLLYAVLAVLIIRGSVRPTVAALVAALWTWAAFIGATVRSLQARGERAAAIVPVLKNDRFWAGLLAGCAIFMMFYFC